MTLLPLSSIPKGVVGLVGAGPGEPGWITVRGLQWLRAADVVVFDALANPTLLAEAPPSAEHIDVGKRARAHKLTQDQTNDLLVEKAKQGLTVVRLKGGDPCLFGRGAEEAAYLARHGIQSEIVPGITSGMGAPLAAGIPVTHREIASTLTFVTGHEDPTKSESSIDYASLAGLIRAGGTACFYMGVGRLGAISNQLQSAGLPADMPVAIIQWGATPRQRSIRTTLATALADLERAGLGSPAIIVVGKVAGIVEPGLDFFTRRPLFGQRILVTRTRQQASELRVQLADLGAEVIEAPTIELAPPADWALVDDAIRHIRSFDWLLLTSANGVGAVAERLAGMSLDARHFAGVKIGAIGDSTADACLSKLGIRPDLIPTRFVAESMAAELIATHGAGGKKFLLLRADIARPALPKLLSEAGAIITELTAYETRLAPALPESVLAALREGRVDWVTFTSSSTATNLVELLGPEKDLLQKVKIASIGTITSQAIRSLGLPLTIEATESNVAGLVAAIERAIRPG